MFLLKDCENKRCVYNVKGILYYTNTTVVDNAQIKNAAIVYLSKNQIDDVNFKDGTVVVFRSESEITGLNLDYIGDQTGYALWVPPLLAIIFVFAVLYFVRENKDKMRRYLNSIDGEKYSSKDNDLNFTHKKEYQASDQMHVSSPMLVTKTKLVTPRMSSGGRIKQGKENLVYKPLDCEDPSYNMFPLADIDTNIGDFTLRKRTPTKVSTSYMFPIEHDDSTVTTIEYNDSTFATSESSKKTRSASKRNGYPYRKSDGMNGKDKLLHEWNLGYNGRLFDDTMQL